MRLSPALALLALAACTPQTEQYELETGIVMPGPDVESWGLSDSAVMMVDGTLNQDGTRTTFVQYLSAAVSDDEIAAAPQLICESPLPTVLASDIRSTTAAEAIREGTLILTVTCGP